MSELPKGWATSTIGELFESHGGGTPDRSNPDYWNGEIPWLSSGDIKSAIISSATETITLLAIEKSSARMCRPGSILIVVRSGILKHTLPVSILATDAAVNQDIKCFDSGNDDLNRWLAISLRASSQELLSENREGTTVQSVKSETLNNFSLPVPPLAEQRRIVAKLEALVGKVDDCRKRLDKIPILLKRFRQSVLAAACSGRLTADWRERNRESSSPVFIGTPDENLPELWRSCCINDIGKVGNGSTPSRKRSEYWNGNIHWVSSGEVKNNIICETRESISKEGYDNSSVKLLPPGTVLLAMIGEGKTRGQSAILRIEATINQNIAGIVLYSELISSEYLWYWYRGQYETTRQSGSGSGPQALNCKRVRELPLNLPPLPEQHEIVRRVEALFAVAAQLETRYAKAKGYFDRLTQSILGKAFRGELVPQDPSDEPASVLLERIRAQRASAGAPRTTRKPRSAVTAPTTLEPAPSPARRGRPPKAVPPPHDLSALNGEQVDILLSKPARKILKRMKPSRDYARADLADALGLSVGEWNAGINELKDAGLVVQTGERRGARYMIAM
ncbi:MAG TPA: restriction endonuclease subunit S [Candidatus Deferrimicrobiaceae bacterium]